MIFILAVTDWLKSQSLLEISGVISGILCVYLAARNNIWSWPLAIISVLIYTFIFFEEKLYADAGLQIYFLFTNIYGWYFWTKKSTEYNKTPVSFAPKNLIFLSIL
ncbi:MAG: nicotinamide mononucleotide transporter, partial [Bacteroidetes bacterium]|nr:nicotinamide mononucleotide transporter [Bacteroidota bacterium]